MGRAALWGHDAGEAALDAGANLPLISSALKNYRTSDLWLEKANSMKTSKEM